MDRPKPDGALVPIPIIALIVAASVMIALGYFLSVVGPSNPESVDPSVGDILLPNLVGVLRRMLTFDELSHVLLWIICPGLSQMRLA